MLSIIKTAIITIIISFISGVLLDVYKNFGPKIVCTMKKTKSPTEGNDQLYILTIRNISKKTIHNLNLNLQASIGKLNISNARITKGLKFDIDRDDNIFDVSIPFLSKNDKFSVELYLENLKDKNPKPIVNLRSPEKFRQANSFDKGLEDIKLFSGKENIIKKDKIILLSKKNIIVLSVLIVLAIILIMSDSIYNKIFDNGTTNTIYENSNPNNNIDSNSTNNSNNNSKKIESSGKNEQKTSSKSETNEKNNQSTDNDSKGKDNNNSAIDNSSKKDNGTVNNKDSSAKENDMEINKNKSSENNKEQIKNSNNDSKDTSKYTNNNSNK